MKAKLENIKGKVQLAREKIDLTINRTTGLMLADLNIPQDKIDKEKQRQRLEELEKLKANEDGDFIEDEDFYDKEDLDAKKIVKHQRDKSSISG